MCEARRNEKITPIDSRHGQGVVEAGEAAVREFDRRQMHTRATAVSVSSIQ
jgi:hypothetical protein